LSGSGAFVVGALASRTSVGQPSFVQEPPLRSHAAAKGVVYGAATGYGNLLRDAAFAARFQEECGILVPENEMKMGPLRPTPDSFNFVPSDWLEEFARTRGLLFRGHTLVWHSQLPSWFQSTANTQNANQILLQHISTVAGRYAGKMHSWDVVNEAINVPDGRADGLRNTPWLQLLGPDYIEIAFRAAAEADPNTMLVYNDFGLDYDTTSHDQKRNAVLKLLERLKTAGVPIHAFGMQAHLSASETRFSAAKIQTFFRNVADLGLKIMITELDVRDQTLPADVAIRDSIVAKVYQDYLSAALSEPAVIAVLTWGLADRYTWLSSFAPRADGVPVRPLPLDADLNRKPAWSAMAGAFDTAPMR
jgi:endo-1,4-beta-xylanase